MNVPIDMNVPKPEEFHAASPRAMRLRRLSGRVGVLASTALALGLVSCGQPSQPVQNSQDTPVSSSAAPNGEAADGGRQTEGAATAGPTAEQPRSITLAFAGDVHFERQVAGLLDQSEKAWSTKLPELRDADFAMVNLETALGSSGSPAPKTFTFRAPGRSLDRLSTAGIDAVTMANNHAVDYGRAGLQDTFGITAKAKIPVVGIGKDATTAFTPLVVDVEGVDTAVLASSQVVEWTSENWSASEGSAGIATDLDPARLRAAVRDAAAKHDLVVVFMHWGTEGSSCPNEKQIERVQQLTQDGADIIVGTHAHRLQANGWHERAFVGYGLGNFIWYNHQPDSRPSGVLTVTVDADAARARGESHTPTTSPLVTDFTWTPKRIAADGEPMSVTGAARDDVVGRMDQALACSELAPRPQ